MQTKKPEWLRVKAPGAPEYLETREIVKGGCLHTVCEEAQCPNIGECWTHSTATFMIMGEYCTRACRFCAVKKGSSPLAPVDGGEPERVGRAVAELKLKHAVVTSVTRDDLPDGGASHFAATARAIHHHAPRCTVEFLIPDLKGNREHLGIIIDSGVDILNHNVETVPRLYPAIRPQAVYERSLSVLRMAKELKPSLKTKSGLMVGLGESREEVLTVMNDLRYHDVDIITIGQYLRPSGRQAELERYVTPDEFREMEEEGLKRGFAFVESSPLVRSSYHAWKHTA